MLSGYTRFSAPRQRLFAALFVVASATYPIWVYFGLQSVTPTVIVIALLALLLARACLVRRDRGIPIAPVILLAATGVVVLYLIDSMAAVRAYPVLVNMGLAMIFAYSLLSPPSAIERIARLAEPDLDEAGIAYTRKVTWIWLIFFVANGLVAAWTAIYGTLDQWTIYNGLISYGLIGIILAVEYLVRRVVRARVKA